MSKELTNNKPRNTRGDRKVTIFTRLSDLEGGPGTKSSTIINTEKCRRGQEIDIRAKWEYLQNDGLRLPVWETPAKKGRYEGRNYFLSGFLEEEEEEDAADMAIMSGSDIIICIVNGFPNIACKTNGFISSFWNYRISSQFAKYFWGRGGGRTRHGTAIGSHSEHGLLHHELLQCSLLEQHLLGYFHFLLSSSGTVGCFGSRCGCGRRRSGRGRSFGCPTRSRLIS